MTVFAVGVLAPMLVRPVPVSVRAPVVVRAPLAHGLVVLLPPSRGGGRVVAEHEHVEPCEGVDERRTIDDAPSHARWQSGIGKARDRCQQVLQPLEVLSGDGQHAETDALGMVVLAMPRPATDRSDRRQ